MSYYDDSSLFVAPNGYKASVLFAQKPMDANGQLAFTRSNDTATRVASNGLIERVRTNQIRNSSMVGASAPSTLPTNWTLVTSGLTFTVIGTGTEGGFTYIEINATGTASSSNARIGFDSSTQILGATGQYWTNSFYFKKVSETAAPDAYAMAIFENTSAGSLVVANVGSLPATTSLARYSYTVLTSGGATVARVQPFVRFSLTSGNSYNFTFRIAAPQMETGDIATDYIATTTTAVSVGPVANIPRIDYLGGGCGKILLEPQRTNTILWSEQINTTNWPASTRINVTANDLISPDGYQNADVIIPNTTSGNHGPAQNVSGLTSGATYSCSIYAKAQGYSKFLILAGAGTGSGQYEFDLNAGTAQAGATITSVGNGWYRCTAPLVPNSSLLQYLIFISNGSAYSYAGNGTSGIAFWGAQVELGAYATSYIPTLAASVTRGADLASAPYTGLTTTSGSLFIDLKKGFAGQNINSGVASLGLRLSSTGTNNSVGLRDATSGTFQGVMRVDATSSNLGAVISGTAATKVCFVWTASTVKMFKDGALFGSASISTPAVFNTIELPNSTRTVIAPLSQFLIFPTALSDAEAIAITTL